MIGFNLKQLEAFAAVVESKSFTAAAEKLYLAQSTVSSHIQSLEEELGIVLLNRESKKTVQLTEEGNRVYKYAKKILSDCAALQDDVDRGYGNELLIGASSLPSQKIVPDLVSAFIRKYKQYCCTIQDGDSEEIHRKILNGQVEVGFVGSSDNRQMLYYEKVAEDHLVLATPNNMHFRELKEKNVYGSELLGEPVIVREAGSATQKIVDNYLSERCDNKKQLHVVSRVSNLDAMRDMIIKGVGVAILSESTVWSQVQSGQMLCFELEEIPVKRNIYLAYRKNAVFSDQAKLFIDFVQEEISK